VGEEIGKVLPGDRYPDHRAAARASDLALDDGGESGAADGVVPVLEPHGGGISERGSDSAEVHVRGIADEHGRLMVVMIHNSDIPDAWEREAEDQQYFFRFSPGAYAVASTSSSTPMTH
jgi:hypothetical protein